jgi:hypothetical protein
MNAEVEHELAVDAVTRDGFEREGMRIDDEAYASAWELAVDSYVPDAYRAVNWHLGRRDLHLLRRVHD